MSRMKQAQNAIMMGHVDPTLDPMCANALLITWDNTVKKVNRPIMICTTCIIVNRYTYEQNY